MAGDRAQPQGQPSGERWSPSGVVTLTTDFGLCDPYVGIMKGVLLSRCPTLRCVDLTHAVPPQDVRAAAFWLSASWRVFPPGTVHVAVVDPGVGSARRILVAREAGHVFLAPDNGLLDDVLSTAASVRFLDEDRFGLPGRSSTFHGRDVLAPAAGALASGLDPEDAGPPAEGWGPAPSPPRVRRGTGETVTEVFLVDGFGNLITALEPGPEDGDLSAWEVEIAGRTVPIARTYADVKPGQLLALVDSFGHLEIAVRDGDAARELGAGRGTPLTLRRRTT